ncbi:DNA-binding transcriptional regulator, LysR family [Cohaesibacter sp. ES.047]|nr:DNA-binding transcriptional regulator, LysR family [Cohaesibacter sp. ES.047]
MAFVYSRKTGSASAAAREMGLSVTTVIAAITRLEDQLNTSLFLKTRKGNLPAVGSNSVLFFAMLLLGGLSRIENAFGEDNVPISMSELESRTECLMKLDDSLDAQLEEWRRLRLSPKLIFRFIAVYEHGSINSAAVALGIAQPQLSRQIAQIEKILGTRLFERGTRGLRPLRSADIFYAGAGALNAICERNIRRGDLLFMRDVKSVKIGSIPPLETRSYLCTMIAKICGAWQRIDPMGQVRISTASCNQLMAELKNHELHAAIVDSPRIPYGFSARVLRRYRLKLAGTNIHAQAENGLLPKAALKELMQKRCFVLPGRDTGLRTLVDEWLQTQELDPQETIEVDSITILASMTRQEAFISLLPSQGLLELLSEVQTFDIPDAPELVQTLIWNEEAAQSRPVSVLNHIITSF